MTDTVDTMRLTSADMEEQDADKLQVLIVDDDSVLQTVCTALLKNEGYGVAAASSGEEAMLLLRDNSYEIALIDVHLPGMGGLDLLREVKREWPDIQVIIMTGYASLESAIAALRSGAYDFLDKPYDDPTVIPAVVGRAAEKSRLIRENARLIHDLKRTKHDIETANRRLRDLAIRDGLTGLYNHRYVQECLSMEVERSSRYDHDFSLIFVDVDYFKRYNDTHGHLWGDHLLRALATLLRSSFRESDVIARYGGEEFLILLPEAPKIEALRLAEEMRKHVEANFFPPADTQVPGNITISMGVASFPMDGSNAAMLIKKADAALYRAKEQGRNRVCEA